MKKFICIITSMVLYAVSLAGCVPKGGSVEQGNSPQPSDGGKIDIVCTIFPVYDWVNNIISGREDKFSVTLLGGGADLHSYQPSAEDIAKIHTCDLFVYVGGSSEQWVRDVVRGTAVRTLCLFEALRDDLEEEQSVAGAEHKSEHGHDDDYYEDNDGVYDEHVWLSLNLAEETVERLTDAICGMDSEGSAVYRANSRNYENELESLDREYRTAVGRARNKTVIFADRFPFLYMMEDYDIDYYAAFPGCSSDTEASFETVAHLAEKVKQLNKRTILVLESSKQNIADTVIRSTGDTNRTTAVMNSCQTVTAEDIKNGISYIEIMRGNLVSLKAALE